MIRAPSAAGSAHVEPEGGATALSASRIAPFVSLLKIVRVTRWSWDL